MIARLRDGVTPERAAAECRAVVLKAGSPNLTGAVVTRLHDAEVGHARWRLVTYTWAVALVLAMACANIAGVLLVRGASRAPQLAVRMALGASLPRIFRQIMLECAWMAVFGAVLGLVLSWAGARLLALLAPATIPRLVQVGADFTPVAFVILVALAAGLLAGLVPATALTARARTGALTRGSTRASRGSGGWMTDVLVCAQLSVVAALLVNAGLAGRTLWNEIAVDLGFDPANVVGAQVTLGQRYWSDPAQYRLFQSTVRDSLLGLPGVERVGFAFDLPPTPVLKAPIDLGDGTWRPVLWRVVSPTYFSILGIPVLSGAVPQDRHTEGLVAVNAAFVKQYYGGGDALGRAFRRGQTTPREVVAVVGDAREQSPIEEPFPSVYQFLGGQEGMATPSTLWVLLDVPRHIRSLDAQIASRIHEIDSLVPVTVERLDAHVARGREDERFLAVLLAVFSGLTVLLGGLGVFAAINHSVRERTHEFGVRVACGATPAHIVKRILARAIVVAGLASAAGVFAGVLTAQASRSFLFGLDYWDPVAVAVTLAVVVCTVLFGASGPARRVTRMDASAVLRAE